MIKNSDDIKGMRVAGKLAAQTLEMIGEHVKPGISTGELDKICHDFIVDEIDFIHDVVDLRRCFTNDFNQDFSNRLALFR